MSGATDTRGRALSMSARELTALALVSVLIVLLKSLIHVPLHVPGHTGVFWMALLVVGRGIVRRRGAASLVGLVSGVLAVALAPGREGLLVGVKYFAAGVTMDAYVAAVGDRLQSPVVAAIGGAAANAAKLLTSTALGIALGIPAGFLAIGLGLAAASHVFFGAIGGALGAVVLGRLQRSGLPQLAGYVTPEEAQR